MDETVNDGGKKRSFNKKVIAIIVIAIIVIGGSVAAFVMLNLSDKQKYFLAEKKSLDFMIDRAEDRYQPEFDWLEQTEDNPTESAVQLSADYNDPKGGNIGGMNPQSIINNATLGFTTQMDMNNKQMAAEMQGSFGDLEVDDIHLYLTDEKVMAGVPFLDEILQIKSDDIGDLLHEADPESFTGEENPDFATFFDKSVMSDEDESYLKKEYIGMIYDELPDGAFKATDETIKINDDSIDTEKLTMHLTEDEVKEILQATFEKMQQDDRLKEIMQDQFEAEQFGLPADVNPEMQNEFNDFINDFDTALDEAQEGIKDLHIPDGVTSTIWKKDKLIVKREFTADIGLSKDELVSLAVDGTQSLKDNQQTFDYHFHYADDDDEGTMQLTGDLSFDDDEISDSIKLSAAGNELTYDGSSTLKDGKRDFERIFSVEDSQGEGGQFIWTGNTSYEKDKMSAEHKLSADAPAFGITEDMFTLNIDNSGKTIKGVDMPDKDNVKDIGGMSSEDLDNYFETEVAPQAQQWLFSLIGAGAMGF